MARPILILTGVEAEARVLAHALALGRLAGVPFVAFGNELARVCCVGLGARLLDERLPLLASGLSSPLVVSAGLCGGLSPRLPAGSLVVPAEVLDGRGGRQLVSGSLPGRELQGALVTVGEALATPEAKARLYEETGALAADMESAPILAAARRQGWPALVVRAVSDDAREGLPAEILDAVDASGRVHTLRMVRAFLARPALVWRALALRRIVASGLGAVAETLRPLLS